MQWCGTWRVKRCRKCYDAKANLLQQSTIFTCQSHTSPTHATFRPFKLLNANLEYSCATFFSSAHVKIFFSPPPAVRTATLGTWRMLTLGAEYEDTWSAPSPAKSRGAGQRVQVEVEAQAEAGPVEEAETEALSWRRGDADALQKYDGVLHLDGRSRAGRRDGVRHLVTKHEAQNRTAPRWRKQTSQQCFFSHWIVIIPQPNKLTINSSSTFPPLVWTTLVENCSKFDFFAVHKMHH